MFNKYKELLSAEESSRVFQTLTEEQRRFIQEDMVRSRRTCFAKIMAERKGAHIPEDASFEEIERLVEDWSYIRYTDAGEVSDSLKCDCGRSLRYAHTVQNRKTGATHTFGITHLELHTGIDASIVALIKSGFEVLDYEFTEMMVKLHSGWSLEKEFGQLPPGLDLPEVISEHLRLQLPLLDRHILQLKRRMQRLEQRITFGQGSRVKLKPSIDNPITPGSAEAPPKVWDVQQPELDLFGVPFHNESMLQEEAVHLENKELPLVPLRAEHPLLIQESWKTPIKQYLQQGVKRSRVICELIIREAGAPDDRFLSGKPKLYPIVCFYLDRLVEEGMCELVEWSQEDRIYQWVSR